MSWAYDRLEGMKLPDFHVPAPQKLQRRHIAIVTETFAPDVNGVANTLGHLCHGLLSAGHTVTLVRPVPTGDVSRIFDAGEHADSFQEIRVRGVPLPRYRELQIGWPSATLLRTSWAQSRPDQVYVATQGPLGWSAQRAARKLAIPVCAGFHTNFQTYSRYYGLGFMQRFITLYLRLFHNRAALTLVPTQRMQEHLLSLGIPQTAVWSRGVDCGQFSPELRDPALRQAWGVEEEDLAVLYVGRLAAEKNLRQVSATFDRLLAIHPRARLVLVGDGPLKAGLAQRYPDYLFCGMQTGTRLAQHYASGDLLLFPSKTDTFGNVVIEAMASGLPVVAYDDGAAAEHIDDGVSGLTVPLDDDEAFTRAALRLADRPSLRSRMGKAARREALSLSWSRLVEQFLVLIPNAPPEVAEDAARQSYPPL